ncbi:allantoate amidohydrolase [Longispora albida]|uniref:allantoate amidohydrolase n=1 Tax=Longispora albida TaxID=203523 RepID=UPI000A2F4C57|nr:allantoate amidohydrolase [Longispora albida]
MSFEEMWRDLAPVGRYDATGGYRRYTLGAAELECRAWFREEAAKRGLTLETDRNGNLWAWWGDPAAGDAVVTGSHLDSVPDGGAFDGPLGVVSAFAAVDLLRSEGFVPRRPIAVTAFAEEEGARFGIACLGSRLLAGAISAEKAAGLTDAAGVRFGDVMAEAGFDPGPDPALMAKIGVYIELHVEQGRGLIDIGRSVAVGEAIWPHGRWRLDFTGEANHAGTTRLEDRRDPMLTYANTVLAARKKAAQGSAVATIGKLVCEPNGTNAVPSRVTAWLDARAPKETDLHAVVAEIERASAERAARDETGFAMVNESYTGDTPFDPVLRDRLALLLNNAPVLGTGAGHDAGVLSVAGVPTAMLFVRNPTGVSHSPAEYAEIPDCLEGVIALADVLRELAA